MAHHGWINCQGAYKLPIKNLPNHFQRSYAVYHELIMKALYSTLLLPAVYSVFNES